jgi:hypothetical protein
VNGPAQSHAARTSPPLRLCGSEPAAAYLCVGLMGTGAGALGKSGYAQDKGDGPIPGPSQDL